MTPQQILKREMKLVRRKLKKARSLDERALLMGIVKRLQYQEHLLAGGGMPY